MLALANDMIEGNPLASSIPDALLLEPDYRKPGIDVFKNFIQFVIMSSESPDITCRPWAPILGKERLPSWIAYVSASAYGSPEGTLLGHQNGDSFVGTSTKRKGYDATPKTVAVSRF